MKRVDEMQVELTFIDVDQKLESIVRFLTTKLFVMDVNSKSKCPFLRVSEIYSLTCDEGEPVNICFVTNGFTKEWVSEIFDYLKACKAEDLYINYADNDGSCGGYFESSESGLINEHFNDGEDISVLNESLLSVLSTWNSMGHVFEEDE